nr:MAG TPA_asm: hypothetical protein [Caudoviricetes sp.]
MNIPPDREKSPAFPSQHEFPSCSLKFNHFFSPAR